MPDYIVRTISPITTEDPVSAANIYMGQLENTPLESLVYRVEDTQTREMYYVFDGEAFTMDELLQHMEGQGEPPEQDMDEGLAERVAAAKESARDEETGTQ